MAPDAYSVISSRMVNILPLNHCRTSTDGTQLNVTQALKSAVDQMQDAVTFDCSKGFHYKELEGPGIEHEGEFRDFLDHLRNQLDAQSAVQYRE